MKTLYQVLGVDVKFTTEELKVAFRKLSLKHHPDRGGDSEVFKEISLAFEVLSDPEKKKHYDRTGETSQKSNHVEQKIRSMLMEAFLQDSKDPIQLIRDQLLSDFRQILSVKNQASKDVKKLQKKLDKFEQVNSKTPNSLGKELILESLAFRILEIEDAIKEGEMHLNFCKECQEFLKDLSCPVEKEYSSLTEMGMWGGMPLSKFSF